MVYCQISGVMRIVGEIVIPYDGDFYALTHFVLASIAKPFTRAIS